MGKKRNFHKPSGPYSLGERDNLMCFFVATEGNQDEHHNKIDLNGVRENNYGGAVGTRIKSSGGREW